MNKSAKELTNEELSDWLTQEVKDLLDAGHVGLYEFFWLLNNYSDLDKQRANDIAKSSLDRLVSDGCHLAYFIWPNFEPSGSEDKPVKELDERVWNDPIKDKPYLALVSE